MHFEVTVSEVDNYLGMQIRQTNDGAIEISQTAKVVCLLESYGMSDANPVKLPFEPGWWPGDSPLLDDKTGYREVIGSLLYLDSGCNQTLPLQLMSHQGPKMYQPKPTSS